MAKYLIINADDFGLTKSINEGIVKAFRNGVLSSANLMPSGEAFADAVSWMKELGIKESGVHLSLTESIPTLKAYEIPTLVSKEGRFHSHHTNFFIRFFLGKISKGEMLDELRNQLDMVRDSGIKINYLSSHEHVHMMPGVLNMFIELAREYEIPAMRCIKKEYYRHKWGSRPFYRSVVLSLIGKNGERIMKREGMGYPDNFLGFVDSGSVHEVILLDMINSLKDGITELVMHPGFLGPEVLERYRFHINCESELHAITSPRVRKAIEDNGIKLTNYAELSS